MRRPADKGADPVAVGSTLKIAIETAEHSAKHTPVNRSYCRAELHPEQVSVDNSPECITVASTVAISVTDPDQFTVADTNGVADTGRICEFGGWQRWRW